MLLRITQKSPLHHYLEKNEKYFLDNYLDPSYNAQQYKGKLNPYYLNYGIKEPMLESAYYSDRSGIKSNLYMSRGLAFGVIYPYLARVEFIPAYADKNMEGRMLDIKNVQKDTDVLLAQSVVYNMNGVFFNADDKEISKDEAIRIICNYRDDLILKPSIGTYGGQGVKKLYNKGEGYDRTMVANLLEEYQQDFVFQEVVIQHPDLAKFNPTSVNTIRVVTYRNPRKERKVLYTLIRFGGKGSINDNASSGGGLCAINKETGELKDRIKHIYRVTKKDIIDDSIPNKIPYFDKIITAALRLHGQFPHFDICGWDFTVTEDGHPVLIEYNIRPGHGLQEGVGPLFTQEDMDEIMQGVSKRTERYEIREVIDFTNKPGFGIH